MSSITTNFSLPSQLNYTQPPQQLSGQKNFVSFKPKAGTSFTGNDNIQIPITSTNSFLDPTRSYLKFRVSFAGTTSASHRTPLSGYSYAFDKVDTYVGGVLVESIADYNKYVACLYKRLPAGYQSQLAVLEQYNEASSTTNGVCGANAGVLVCHAPRVALFEQTRHIPLSFIRGGIELNFTVLPFSQFIAVNNAGSLTGYTIDQVELIACMIQPSDAFLSSFAKSLQSGSEAKIPLEVCRTIKSFPQNSSVNTYTLNTGFHKSLNSILNTNAPTVSGAGTDGSNLFTNNGQTSYRYEISGSRYPQNFNIYTNSATAGGMIGAEQVMMGLCAVDNTFTGLNQQTSDIVDVNGNFNYTDFRSDASFASGVPISDGQVVFVAEGTPSTTTNITNYSWVFVNALLKISMNSVSLDTKELQ